MIIPYLFYVQMDALAEALDAFSPVELAAQTALLESINAAALELKLRTYPVAAPAALLAQAQAMQAQADLIEAEEGESNRALVVSAARIVAAVRQLRELVPPPPAPESFAVETFEESTQHWIWRLYADSPEGMTIRVEHFIVGQGEENSPVQPPGSGIPGWYELFSEVAGMEMKSGSWMYGTSDVFKFRARYVTAGGQPGPYCAALTVGPIVPRQPTNHANSVAQQNNVVNTFSDPGGDWTGLEAARSPHGQEAWSEVVVLTERPEAMQYNDTSVDTADYDYRMRLTRGSTPGPWSAILNVVVT